MLIALTIAVAVLGGSAASTDSVHSAELASVVGVSDDDTITVLRERRPVAVRLNAIDCPEGGQAFGATAKRFTSELVFGKTVTLTRRGQDRYGRMLADVSVEGQDVGLALVKAGLAWHFTRYSDDLKLSAAEQEARAARRGLWRDPNPVPPWEYRHPLPTPMDAAVIFHGNRRSRVFHGPTCQHYHCENCTIEFDSAATATAAGFRPHAECTK